MNPRITSDEWLAELERLAKSAPDGGDPGLTAMEISEKTGLDVRKVRERIRQGLKEGTIRVGQGYRERIDGILHRYPVYLTVKTGGRRGRSDQTKKH